MATRKAELYKAIKAHCNECNDVHGGWNESNDCTGKNCPLYPMRPGNGPGHLEQMRTVKRDTTAMQAAAKAARDRKAR